MSVSGGPGLGRGGESEGERAVEGGASGNQGTRLAVMSLRSGGQARPRKVLTTRVHSV